VNDAQIPTSFRKSDRIFATILILNGFSLPETIAKLEFSNYSHPGSAKRLKNRVAIPRRLMLSPAMKIVRLIDWLMVACDYFGRLA